MRRLRDSGKIVGRSASVRQVARQCNQSFPLSLRQFVSTHGCPFPRCNRLHIKILTDPNIPIEIMLNRMREVYSTATIGVEVTSREDLSSIAAFNDLNDLDVGQCRRGTTTNEQNQLFMHRNNVGDGEIVLYFVRSTVPANNGCAAHPDGQPGAVIAQNASQWTLAHEVGHVLGLQHISGEKDAQGACITPDFTRLMTGCSTSNITGTPTVDQNEVNTMKDNDLTSQC